MRLWSEPLAGQQLGEPRHEEWHSGPCTVTSQVAMPEETQTTSMMVPERCVGTPGGVMMRSPWASSTERKAGASWLGLRPGSISASHVLASMPRTTSAAGWRWRQSWRVLSKRDQKSARACKPLDASGAYAEMNKVGGEESKWLTMHAVRSAKPDADLEAPRGVASTSELCKIAVSLPLGTAAGVQAGCVIN